MWVGSEVDASFQHLWRRKGALQSGSLPARVAARLVGRNAQPAAANTTLNQRVHGQQWNSPRPTAVPTSSLPSGRSGGSAAGLPTLPFTVPRASAITWMPPSGPSPLNVTYSRSEHVRQSVSTA